MKKAIAILLTALLLLTVFVSCEGDVEDLFGDNITITFDGNGSTSGKMDALKVKKGEDFKLTKNAFEKTNYIFTGWNTADDGSGTAYANEGTAKFDKDTTLYAQWKGGPSIIKNTEGTLTLTSGDWTIEDATVTVTGRITIEGTVNLLLPDGKTLNANSGITVSKGNTLVIDKFDSESNGTGTLKATGVYNCAGIGGGNVDGYRTAGTITVKYGTVTANGGENGAGIGGGYHGAGGSITISGGTVNATGGYLAAGIGGGQGYYEDYSVGAGGTISISGGDITATGGNSGAGIGGGMNGNGGTLSVSDGTVVANGGVNGAGIGGGLYANGGIVIIEGGTVSATGNAGGAGIGGGNYFNGVGGNGADVTISGGAVRATGSDGAAGIGAGKKSSLHGTLKIGTGYVLTGGSASADTLLLGPVDEETEYPGSSSHPRYMKASKPIVLTNSTTAWTGGNFYTLGNEDVTIASRITVTGKATLLLPDGKKLTASEGITVSSGNTLVIDKYGSTATGIGILNATGPDDSAGIGGVSEDGKKVAGTVIINNGVVYATGGEDAAGIGGGEGGNGGTVTINGGTVTANGGVNAAGIGGGVDGDGGTVTINGGKLTATGGYGAAGIGGGVEGGGGTVTINGGTVTATGGENTEAGIGAGTNGSIHGDLIIGSGVTMQVKDSEGASWGPYVVDVRHRYMKADEVN